MMIKEYRICLPLSVAEYRIAQLYMIQVGARSGSCFSLFVCVSTTRDAACNVNANL